MSQKKEYHIYIFNKQKNKKIKMGQICIFGSFSIILSCKLFLKKKKRWDKFKNTKSNHKLETILSRAPNETNSKKKKKVRV